MPRFNGKWANFNHRGWAWTHFWQDARVEVASTNFTINSFVDDISGSFTANIGAASGNLQISGFVSDISGSIVSNVSSGIVLQGVVSDISGSLVASTSTSGSIQSFVDSISGNFTASLSTNSNLQGIIDDITGNFVVSSSLSPVNALLQGLVDDISGNFVVTQSAIEPVLEKDKGISGKKHVTYIKRNPQYKEDKKLRPEDIDKQVYNLLFSEAKAVIADKLDNNESANIIANSVVDNVIHESFEHKDLVSEKEIVANTKAMAYLMLQEHLQRLRKEDIEILLIL